MRLKVSLILGITMAVFLLTLTLLAWLETAVAQTNPCTSIYNLSNGWAIEMCEGEAFIGQPMEIVLDGVMQTAGNRQLAIYHQSEQDEGMPQVMVLASSGYVRLKQNADPAGAPIPFGGSFVLGPAYWEGNIYHHSPQIQRVEIDTTRLPDDSLQITAVAQNGKFDIAYDLTLPPPRDRQTRLRVQQSYTATQPITVDANRRNLHEGFKLVQFSSMFVTADGVVCNGGQSMGCHDSDGVRYIDDSLERRQITVTTAVSSRFLFSSPTPLGNNWLDLLHTNDEGWQGNTPNLRIALASWPLTRTVTPQGWLAAASNPTNDNLGLWLHDDGEASVDWAAGKSDTISYWLLAEDDPPDPWSALNLRGDPFLDFEGAYDCFSVLDAAQTTTAAVAAINGYQDTAVQITYDLGSSNGSWAQLRCNFDPPLDLSAFDHLRFDWRGDVANSNSLEVGLVNLTTDTEHIFARAYGHASHRDWWGQLVMPFSFLHPWTENTTFDPSQVSAIFVSVVKSDDNDAGGNGRLALDNLTAQNLTSRTVPASFEVAASEQLTVAKETAVQWLLSQQQPTGLLRSWEPEAGCVAHTYDQALALLVFSHAGEWEAADQIVAGLESVQLDNGAWTKSNDCQTLEPVHTEQWLGDVAWAVYALNRYQALGGSYTHTKQIRNQAANWLLEQINPADGCLKIDHTEGTIDTWWALYTSQSTYVNQANGIKNCLLTQYWDDEMGRFKGGRSWHQPYLDNQTWGAAFLKAIGEPEKARRALSYAYETLRLPAQGGELVGFDGQAGPWSVWNEGTAQFAAIGGANANFFVQELVAQQQPNGSMPGSPDDFRGGGVWTTTWSGIAPTAWLYFTLNGEPFHTEPFVAYLPVLAQSLPMNPIENGGDGNFTVSWPCVADTTAYWVQSATSPRFEDAKQERVTACSLDLFGQSLGYHYFRMKPDSRDYRFWSKAETAVVTHLTIDDFEDGANPNALQQTIGWEGPCVLPQPSDYDPINTYGNSQFGYWLAYQVTPTCYATWKTGLGGWDYSSFSTVTFQIKGARGGEAPHLYLYDSHDVRRYIVLPRLTTDWQTVTVPLSAFAQQGVDLKQLAWLQIVFEWQHMSGTVYVDDIKLH